MAETVLRADGIEAGYGRVQVLWGAGVTVRRKESVVLLGANGAGKTTLLKVLVGLLPAWKGHVFLDPDEVTAWRTDRRVRRGLAYMSEIGVFPGLTIEENLRVGGQFIEKSALKTRMEELYGYFPDLATRRGTLGGALSGGQRKMLGIAKALASSPKLLVMDEPSAGLSPLFVSQVIQVLSKFREQGLAMLIAEQNIAFLDLADRVFTLEGGRIRFEGTVAELEADDSLHKAYFGLS
ncbi:MAG: ABC transporter ATP-binding protein [Rhodospirillales bacterium]|nr:ABC transporter ATP-binding protein [Rhodospirillales bacterium]MBN8903871.1 ABC transporter ATP-binding protein [Rhodospirillales bacterium]